MDMDKMVKGFRYAFGVSDEEGQAMIDLHTSGTVKQPADLWAYMERLLDSVRATHN